jgi:hypothetical protein
MEKKRFIDVTHLNWVSLNSGFIETGDYECWPSCFLSNCRCDLSGTVRSLRIQLSYAQEKQELYRKGSVPVHGLRPAHFQGKSARYRSVPPIPGQFALRHGHSRVGDPNQPRLRQRVSGLARLFRTRAGSHSQGSQTVRSGSIHRRDRRDRLRYRRFHDRPMHESLSLGSVSKEKIRHQAQKRIS